MSQEQPRNTAHLVVDTNVSHEIYGGFREVLETSRNSKTMAAMLEDPQFRYRVLRVRASLCLVWLCHKRGWRTVGHGTEAADLLIKKVPPNAQSPETTFTKMLLNFVNPQVVPGWSHCRVTSEDPNITGERVDNALLSLAVDLKIPLITYEGHSPTAGFSDVNNRGYQNLRGKCQSNGVEVFTPAEFLKREGLAVEQLGREFFGALKFARKPAALVCSERNLRFLRGVYKFVLLEPISGSSNAV